MSPPKAVMEDVSYSPYPLGRKLPVAVLAVWAVVDLVVVASGGSHFYFNLFFTLGLLCAAYVFLWLLVGELSLSGESILWRTPMRSGRLQIADVRGAHPEHHFSRGMVTIEMDNGECIRVYGGRRFSEFYNVLRARPHDLSIT
jgi:hypothetical protein